MVTVHNDEGLVIATYTGTCSYWHLAPQLTALDQRCKSLGKVGLPAMKGERKIGIMHWIWACL